MDRAPVELRVGGQTYRVVASAEPTELHRLAGIVSERLQGRGNGTGAVPQQALLLAAMTLAHELEEEREKRKRVEQRSREMLTHVLARIDAALDADDSASDEAQTDVAQADAVQPDAVQPDAVQPDAVQPDEGRAFSPAPDTDSTTPDA